MDVIDLGYGLGGATIYLKERGHRVFGVDNNPNTNADLIADMRNLTGDDFPFKPYFMWASPPCTEFARESMPWCKTGREPDMSIVLACIRLFNELNPTYYILENVRGARRHIDPLLGKPKKCGSYYLWGCFPIFDVKVTKSKQKIWGTKPELRSLIPYELSKALGIALEREIGGVHPLP